MATMEELMARASKMMRNRRQTLVIAPPVDHFADLMKGEDSEAPPPENGLTGRIGRVEGFTIFGADHSAGRDQTVFARCIFVDAGGPYTISFSEAAEIRPEVWSKPWWKAAVERAMNQGPIAPSHWFTTIDGEAEEVQQPALEAPKA